LAGVSEGRTRGQSEMIDTATIKQAAIDSDETGFASVLTNNDTVIALCDEIERLTACLKKANDQAEHFEREWYLRGDEIERLRKDAARYQWLKRERVESNYEGELSIEFECGFDHWNDIDAAIDAAMEAK